MVLFCDHQNAVTFLFSTRLSTFKARTDKMIRISILLHSHYAKVSFGTQFKVIFLSVQLLRRIHK